jgi:protein-S-isoprenylcysteine O-methyltransferase Ste14
MQASRGQTLPRNADTRPRFSTISSAAAASDDDEGVLGLPFESGVAAAGFGVAVAAFALDELWIAVRTAGSRAPRRDRGSKAVISIGIFVGVFSAAQLASRWEGGTIPWPWLPYAVGALAVAAGMVVRIWAVRTLGRWFTTVVRVADDQEVVSDGPFRWVRHPSYLGLLLILAGLGLMLTDWVSFLLAVLVPLAALVWRIQVEERALRDGLGTRYDDYAAGRKRLLPGVW